MTVSSQINKIIYIGNGVAKEFAELRKSMEELGGGL